MTAMISRSQYSEILKGQRVVLLGHAPHLRGSGYGHFIEQYDLIVRINDGIPEAGEPDTNPPEGDPQPCLGLAMPRTLVPDIGYRTNILYHQLDLAYWPSVVDLAIEAGVKVLCSAYAKGLYDSWGVLTDKVWHLAYGRIPFRETPMVIYNQLEMGADIHPTPGAMAIMDLLSFDLAELFLTGFTFYAGSDEGDYRDSFLASGSSHAPIKEAQLLTWLISRDSRVTVDPVLADIITTYQGSRINEKRVLHPDT